MTSLPHLATIFDRLRRGYHFTPADGDLFRVLWNDFDAYEKAFGAFGLRLHKHHQNVVYLAADPSKNPGKQARTMGLFVLVMVESMSNEYAAIVPPFFDTWWRIEELPHLASERYREYMEQVDINDADDLARVVRLLEKYGFAETRTGGAFQFRTAAYRFLDLCIDAVEMSEASGTAPNADAETDPSAKPLPPLPET
ncbi:MAG: condensin complex protein MksE [Bacteroidota bacterium]